MTSACQKDGRGGYEEGEEREIYDWKCLKFLDIHSLLAPILHFNSRFASVPVRHSSPCLFFCTPPPFVLLFKCDESPK